MTEYEELDARVKEVYGLAIHIIDLISCHDFSMAEIQSRKLADYCKSTNVIANRLADSD